MGPLGRPLCPLRPFCLVRGLLSERTHDRPALGLCVPLPPLPQSLWLYFPPVTQLDPQTVPPQLPGAAPV